MLALFTENTDPDPISTSSPAHFCSVIIFQSAPAGLWDSAHHQSVGRGLRSWTGSTLVEEC